MKISYLDGRPDEEVKEEDFTVTFSDPYGWMDGVSWTMEVNLTQMCKDAGKKVKDWDCEKRCDYYYVDYPIPRFKKVLKLMCKYAAEDTLGEVQKYLDQHFPKWGTEFRKMR